MINFPFEHLNIRYDIYICMCVYENDRMYLRIEMCVEKIYIYIERERKKKTIHTGVLTLQERGGSGVYRCTCPLVARLSLLYAEQLAAVDQPWYAA